MLVSRAKPPTTTMAQFIGKERRELDGVPNVSALIFLEAENVFHKIIFRYDKKHMYTAISKILLALNPCEP